MRSLPPAPALYAIVVCLPAAFYSVLMVVHDFVTLGALGWSALIIPVMTLYVAPPVALGTATIASATALPVEGSPASSLSGWFVRDTILAALSILCVAGGSLTVWIFELRVEDYLESPLALLLWTGPILSLLPVGCYGLFELVRDLARRFSSVAR